MNLWRTSCSSTWISMWNLWLSKYIVFHIRCTVWERERELGIVFIVKPWFTLIICYSPAYTITPSCQVFFSPSIYLSLLLLTVCNYCSTVYKISHTSMPARTTATRMVASSPNRGHAAIYVTPLYSLAPTHSHSHTTTHPHTHTPTLSTHTDKSKRSKPNCCYCYAVRELPSFPLPFFSSASHTSCLCICIWVCVCVWLYVCTCT